MPETKSVYDSFFISPLIHIPHVKSRPFTKRIRIKVNIINTTMYVYFRSCSFSFVFIYFVQLSITGMLLKTFFFSLIFKKKNEIENL